MTPSIGFIGLGRMGLPMAQHLLDADFPLAVFNRTASRADTLRQNGAQWADSPRALAAQSDIVISIIADDAALRAIALGEDGILAGLKPDGIHVDMSTVSPDVTKELAPLYHDRGSAFCGLAGLWPSGGRGRGKTVDLSGWPNCGHRSLPTRVRGHGAGGYRGG